MAIEIPPIQVHGSRSLIFFIPSLKKDRKFTKFKGIKFRIRVVENAQNALSSPLPLPAAAGFVAFGAPLGPQEVPPMHHSRWALRIRSQLARSCSSNPRRWLLPPRIKHGRDVRWGNVRAPRHGFWPALRRDFAKDLF